MTSTMEEIHLLTNLLKTVELCGNKERERNIHAILGTHYRTLGQYDKAMHHDENHLKIAKQIKDTKGEGCAYGNLGKCYFFLDQYYEAIEYHTRHLDIAKKLGDKASQVHAYGNLGACYDSLGMCDKAIDHYERVLEIEKHLGDKESEGKAYGNLGICFRLLGQYDNAIKHHRMHMNIALKIGDTADVGRAHGNLGCCYDSCGQYEKAKEYHEKYLGIAKEIGDKADEGISHGNLGNCYMSLGQYQEAIEHYAMQLKIAKQIKDKAGEGTAYGNVGSCYIYLDQYNEAIKYHEMHLGITQQIGDKVGEGGAYGELGSCYNSLGQSKTALKNFERVLHIAEQTGDKADKASAYCNIGVCYCTLKQYDRAEQNCKNSIQCFEELFEGVPKKDAFKISIRDTFIFVYRLLIKILLLQDKNEEALVIAERGRSKALADLMLSSHPARCGAATEAKDLDQHEIVDVVKALGCTVLFYAFISTSTGTFRWVIQPCGDVKTNWSEVSLQAKKYHSQKDFVSHLKNLKLLIKKATESIRSGCTIKSEDRSLSFLYPEEMSNETKNNPQTSLPSTATCAELPLCSPAGLSGDNDPDPATSLSTEEMTTRMHSRSPRGNENLDNREELEESEVNNSLKELYQIVLGPVRQFVQDERVVVVPDGPLALVPFAALMDENGHYVAEFLQVRLIPSFATAKMIMEHPQEPDGQAFPLIVGDPDVGEFKIDQKMIPVRRLPFAKIEAETVAQLLKVQPLVGESATKMTFLEKFESAHLIHIAAHGDIERGEILLAPSPGTDGKKENAMLMMSDLEGKRTRAQLVVLSCCYSGCGEIRGEGVIGIARAFLGAGARAVLVSLWAVDDQATLYFMNEFYKHLTGGERASEALSNAMEAMRENKNEIFRRPSAWAPFVLIGDDVAPFSKL